LFYFIFFFIVRHPSDLSDFLLPFHLWILVFVVVLVAVAVVAVVVHVAVVAAAVVAQYLDEKYD